MAKQTKRDSGHPEWMDFTVKNAPKVRDFYRSVLGWEFEKLDMGGYSDYVMRPRGEKKGVAGICHARGMNAKLPPVWLLYFTVPDLDLALVSCRRKKGKRVAPIRGEKGKGRFCVIRDPGGAFCALYELPG